MKNPNWEIPELSLDSSVGTSSESGSTNVPEKYNSKNIFIIKVSTIKKRRFLQE
jgi:hypothetical protein